MDNRFVSLLSDIGISFSYCPFNRDDSDCLVISNLLNRDIVDNDILALKHFSECSNIPTHVDLMYMQKILSHKLDAFNIVFEYLPQKRFSSDWSYLAKKLELSMNELLALKAMKCGEGIIQYSFDLFISVLSMRLFTLFFSRCCSESCPFVA
jgi:hypothetical protein